MKTRDRVKTLVLLLEGLALHADQADWIGVARDCVTVTAILRRVRSEAMRRTRQARQRARSEMLSARKDSEPGQFCPVAGCHGFAMQTCGGLCAWHYHHVGQGA